MSGTLTSETFRMTLAQISPVVGDLAGNAALLRAAWEAGRAAGADFVAGPELGLTGCGLRDLARRPAFCRDVLAAVEALAAACADGPALGIGHPFAEGGRVHDAYTIVAAGRIVARVLRHHRPAVAVLDEARLFDAADISGPCRIGPLRIGVVIGDDAAFPDVAETLMESGAEVLLVPWAIPYARGAYENRVTALAARASETGLALVHVNPAGGDADLMFDGASFALNAGGGVAVRLPLLAQAVAHVDLERAGDGWQVREGARADIPDEWESDYRVMVETLRDHLTRSGFSSALLGLSGGVDSALVAAIAVDALGAGNVRALLLPSEFTSPRSLALGQAVAQALGVRCDTVPIDGARAAVGAALASLFAGTSPDTTEENIQSRLRALFLMAVSNKTGAMLLSTGNKSEVTVGYATLYGDMAGGYNPLRDLAKTRVFEICRWRNRTHLGWMLGPPGEVIAPEVIDRPPSAELRADQKDTDSLPPYDVLDPIIEGLVGRGAAIADLAAEGHDRETVERVERMLYLSEFKRAQAAPGTRLTDSAFGRDRRYPLAHRWRDRG